MQYVRSFSPALVLRVNSPPSTVLPSTSIFSPSISFWTSAVTPELGVPAAAAAPAANRPPPSAKLVVSMTVVIRDRLRPCLWNIWDPSGPGRSEWAARRLAVPRMPPVALLRV
nr:hypothetical protein KitaXyl93_49950 [Kitasatospora sp. Xyl93]